MAITDGLVHYWTCDEAAGNLLDRISGLDMTGYHAPSTVDGKCGGSAMFAENKNAVCEPPYDRFAYHANVLTTDPCVLDPSRDFSLCMYFNWQGLLANALQYTLASCLVTEDGFDPSTEEFITHDVYSWQCLLFFIPPHVYVEWRIYQDDLFNYYQVIHVPQLNSTSLFWHTLFLRYDHATKIAYIDIDPCNPFQSRSGSHTNVIPHLAILNSGPGGQLLNPSMAIGGLHDLLADCSQGGSGLAYGANAWIDEVGVWNRVLTTGEMNSICNCPPAWPPPVGGGTKAWVYVR